MATIESKNTKHLEELEAIANKEESYDTSEPQQVNKAKKRYARTRADRLKFVEAAMEHEQGRAWFYDLLTFCHVFSTPFDSDPYRTSFLCGQQNIGLKILSDIQDSSPDGYLKMVNEARGK